MRELRTLILTTVGLCLAGCVGDIRQNDVLIFGTNTKLAVDASASAASGGTPEITIGYKRQEAVWMPLVVNGTHVNENILNKACPASNCTGQLQDLKYQGGAETVSGEPVGTDAYSVFASFGANIKSGALPNDVKSSVGLAQFFATGIAAQRLAQNSQIANALSVQPEETGAAMAAASAAQSPEVLQAITEGVKQAELNKSNAGLLAACATLKAPAQLSTLAPANPADMSKAAVYQQQFLNQLNQAKSAADFTRLIAAHRPDFKPEIDAVIKACGGVPN